MAFLLKKIYIPRKSGEFFYMIQTTRQLDRVNQTGAEMRRLCVMYCKDLGPWLAVPFMQYYRHICELPYIPDPPGVETVSRPAYTLSGDYAPRDCDDKAVLAAAWWHGRGFPVRFVASSTKPNGKLHHVFCQLWNGLFIDPTYRKNENFIGFYPYFGKITRIIALTNFF